MKFKMQDKQNQLIERISDNHLVVGVDIAQQTHVASASAFFIPGWNVVSLVSNLHIWNFSQWILSKIL
jgi:hypothetical protein